MIPPFRSPVNVKTIIIIYPLCFRLYNIQKRTKEKVAMIAFLKVTKNTTNLRACFSSTWNVLLEISVTHFLTDFKCLLKCPLLREVFSDHPILNFHHPFWQTPFQQTPFPPPTSFILFYHYCHFTHLSPLLNILCNIFSLFVPVIVYLLPLHCNYIRAESSVLVTAGLALAPVNSTRQPIKV